MGTENSMTILIMSNPKLNLRDLRLNSLITPSLIITPTLRTFSFHNSVANIGTSKGICSLMFVANILFLKEIL